MFHSGRTSLLAAAALLAGSAGARAQDVNLATDGADIRLRGTATHARGGSYLDHGPLNVGDGRRDLIIGAPGAPGSGLAGSVYVLFGGPIPADGEHSMSTADAIVNGLAAGDGFGTAVANGNILNAEGTNPRNLIVGAPGALGGAGVVYVFAAGLPRGARSASTAVMTVRGVPGDRLGSAIATADLDNDTYRDLIIGAPGNGHVYVIYGGPGLVGQTRDMSRVDALGADVTITGPGLGGVLTAGAVTGDDQYDIFLGAPAVNHVFMIQGRPGRSFPRNMFVSLDETAAFFGPTHDGAGSTLRVGDLDGDGRTDLFIGAPTADPSASGAIYVLFGRKPGEAPLTTRGLAAADVIIRGPAAGARLGEMITSGDINRDNPDDLAAVAPGGGGAGTVIVYYGRARSRIGTVQANGSRLVQLGGGEASVRVLGDPAVGRIDNAFIYDVTGEGARDIIVGVPEAVTASGVGSGLVYFAIAPKMRVSPMQMHVTAVQNTGVQRSIAIVNPSPRAITYTVRANASWLGAAPSGSTLSHTSPGTVSLNASALGFAPGDYATTVDVRSTSEHLDMTLSARVNLTVITQPTLTVNTTFPRIAGTPITWTARATGGAAGLLYKFVRNDPGVGWRVVQDYSSSNTYTWTPQAGDSGVHFLQVWVKTPQSAEGFDAFAGTDAFTITRPGPPASTVTAPAGSSVARRPTYTWNVVGTATWYYLWVQPAGGAPLIQTWYESSAVCGAATCSITPAVDLLTGVAYTVWVQTWNSDNYGSWSQGLAFSTAPMTFTGPTGAVGTPAPGYSWNAVPGALSYDLWVEPAGGSPVINTRVAASSVCQGSTCTATPRTELANGAHSWWVRPVYGIGPGAWSIEGAITVSAAVPGAATVAWPLAGLEGARTPAYRWNHVPASTWYQLWVQPAGGAPLLQTWYFAGDVCRGTRCSVTPSNALTPGTSYTWWVQTWSSRGTGPWNSVAGTTFTVAATAPAGATQVAPTGAAASATPTYTWNRVAGASWYYLWVNAVGQEPLVKIWYRAEDVCGTTTCTAAPAVNLAAGPTYEYWLQTFNDAAYGPWTKVTFSR
jgi:hypothetical protein